MPVGYRAFKMNWKVKALLFRAFDVLPRGKALYFQAQKHITKTVPRRMSPTSGSTAAFLENWTALVKQFDGQDIGTKQFFEFGAGWDLFSNIVFWTLGANHQLVYDLTRWARPEQINLVIRHLRTDPPPKAIRLPGEDILTDADTWQADLKAKYGIDYRAPADATKTGLADRSVDVVVTTSVLEHLPVAVAEMILKECRRIIRPDGIMAHYIDYSDHYAHSDANIGPYNFLRFSEKQWQRYNPGIHYQNRMRHDDYGRLFKAAGFEIRHAHSVTPVGCETFLSSLDLGPEFRGRPTAEILPVHGQYVVEPA